MQAIYDKLNVHSRLEASIGHSRKWDAYDAGREVAETAIKNLKHPPSFFVVFSTMHYRKNGGFRRFLDGIWEILPEETPLIGGTVAGFINNYGSFSRGASALAVSYPNMDVAIGIGKQTKLHPKKAAKDCSLMVKKSLETSKLKNKFLINIISGPTVPFEKINVVKSKFLGKMAAQVGYKMFSIMGAGVGKEEEIIDEMASLLKDYYIIGGSTLDSGKMFHNYQFVDDQVHTNSIVALGCTTDLDIFMKSEIGVHETNKTFNITGLTAHNRIIKEIDNKPAKEEFLKAIGIIEDQFVELGPFYYRTSNYFPITFEEDDKFTSGIAGFLGDYVALGYKARGKKVRLLSITGEEIINLIHDTFKDFDTNRCPFVFIPCSFILPNTLGSKTNLIKNKLEEHIDGIPYLMILTVNENAGTPTEPACARVYSFNTLSIINETRGVYDDI
jgi:hypothetical protein